MNDFIWEDCSTLLELLMSIQSGNHNERITALKRVNRSFFAFDSINYKRWGVLDMVIKESKFPADLIQLFEDTGVWRGNFTTNLNSFMPSDQLHEQGFNLPLKTAIIKNRHSHEILENLIHWLPLRGRLLAEFSSFVFPNTLWTNKEKERDENLQENRRYNEKLEILSELFEQKMSLTYENFKDENYKEELISFSGKSLKSKTILRSNEIGQMEVEKFIQERLIERTKHIKDTIKKTNIETFPFGEKQKKPSKKKSQSEKLELQKQSLLLKVLHERKVFEITEINKHQLSDFHALVSSSDAIVKPNMKTDKSKVISCFLTKVVPEAFSSSKPSECGYIILEGENLIATGPGSKKSVKDHIKALFLYKIKPHLCQNSVLVLMFDDRKDLRTNEIKCTEEKRYSTNHYEIDFNENFLIEDWGLIFKNPANKAKFKLLFVNEIIQEAQNFLTENQHIFLNGVWDDGRMMKLSKDENGYVHYTQKTDWTLNIAESDTKIFQLSEKLNEEARMANEKRTLLIHSLDSDVKLLGIFFSSKCDFLEMVVKSGTGMIPVFFSPQKVVDYMRSNYVGDDIEKKCLSLLKAYALWGCDYLPGFFSINHGLGMMSFDELCRKQVISSTNDFLELILKTYQNKNHLLKRLYTESPETV